MGGCIADPTINGQRQHRLDPNQQPSIRQSYPVIFLDPEPVSPIRKSPTKKNSSSSEDSLQIPYNPQSKTSQPYNSQELNINQMHLFKKYNGQCAQNFDNTVFVKIPINREQTIFQSIVQPLWVFPMKIGMLTFQEVKGGYFQQKMTWLRFQDEKLRINWQHGCQTIIIDRQNVLMSSIQQLQKINLRKEIKIKFDSQQGDDAGGILREWMNLTIKEIFNFQVTGLFKLCNTEQTAYRFVLDPSENEDQRHFRLIVAKLLGMIIGKALFQRISINCFLTKSIWRQICGKIVKHGDFFFYDKEIYKNINFIKENTCNTQLGLNFTYLIPSDTKQSQIITLKPKGEDISVNDTNKHEFITLLIAYFCTKACTHYIQAIRQGIQRILPLKCLELFEPHQMEMLLNGPQFINIEEWKSSTLYKNCRPQDKQIQWFWNYMESLDQNKLGNLLHYVTGTRRVPILGFFYLESNRNQVTRFTIEKVSYQKQNPYPKGHTCFNRLQLPQYHTQKELKVIMDIILREQIDSFGLS